MSAKHTIKAVTEYSKGKAGEEYPTRVIIALGYSASGGYSTHMQARKDDGSTYLFWGHYDIPTFGAALQELRERINKNNTGLPINHFSRIPSMPLEPSKDDILED